MTNLSKPFRIKWKDVPSIANLQASSAGTIRIKETKKIIYPHNAVKGYRWISFEGTKLAVHRLIALAFIHNPLNKPHINHKNGDTSDNRVENIEWCTVAENTTHSIYTLGYVTNFGKRPVNVYKDGELVYEAATVREAAKIVNGVSTHVSQCCKGSRNKHRDHTFKYS